MSTPEVFQRYYDKLKADPVRWEHTLEKGRTRRRGKPIGIKSRAATRRCHQSAKLEALTHYGPNGLLQCSWEGCTVTDLDILELDHINDNGAQEKRDLGIRGSKVYFYVRNNGFPDGYQTLCCNHNRKKEIIRRLKGRIE